MIRRSSSNPNSRIGRALAAAALAAVVFAGAGPAAANPATSGSAGTRYQVELLTMGPGDLVWEKFGHAALCITDRIRKHARCYNYGATNFDDVAALAWGFLRGRSVFWVSTTSRKRMLDHYIEADRTVWSQTIELDDARALELKRQLDHNARRENRNYRYHHFHDNCASRLRDILDEATGGALSAAVAQSQGGPSYRQLARRGYAGDVAILLVSDLFLGRDADRQPTVFEAMFLPDILRGHVAQRLGAEPIVIHQRKGPAFATDPGTGGRWLFTLLGLLLAALVLLAWRLARRRRLAVALATFPLALIGLLVWTVAVISPLAELRFNEALLLFVPLDCAVAFISPRSRRRYAAGRLIVLAAVSLLLVVGLFRQPLWALMTIPTSVFAAIWWTEQNDA